MDIQLIFIFQFRHGPLLIDYINSNLTKWNMEENVHRMQDVVILHTAAT